MENNGFKMTYNVDLVFCIDATGSMEYLIDTVKQNALNMYNDIVTAMQAKKKAIQGIRVRVIAFRDYLVDGEEAMLQSDFFTLPEQAEDFKNCLSYIQAKGGGDIPEDGLEALAYAIRSPWTTKGIKKRHVIVVWTDAPTHPLGFGAESPEYPKNMAKDFDELSKWWGDMQNGGYMDQKAKRLVLFAPLTEHKMDEPSVWTRIANEWDQALMSPAEPEKGFSGMGYEEIIDKLTNTIQ